MKPKKKKETIIIEYWDCGFCSTKHRTEAKAKSCIEKHENKKPRRRYNFSVKDKVDFFTRIRLNGEKLAPIARSIGCCRNTIDSALSDVQRLMITYKLSEKCIPQNGFNPSYLEWMRKRFPVTDADMQHINRLFDEVKKDVTKIDEYHRWMFTDQKRKYEKSSN